jgi:hypothetical protein
MTPGREIMEIRVQAKLGTKIVIQDDTEGVDR